ncbi:MAG: M4 family metallopeptidase, partial [Bacteroidetes bacterium]|nr:M4 family metallopeptidase [Bacteroidota bacterium]
MSKTNLFRLTERSIITFILSVFIFLNNVYPQVKNEQIMEKARSIYQKIERIVIDPQRAVPTTVRGILASNVNLNDDKQARSFLQKSADLFKINNQTDGFITKKVFTDEIGMTHLKLQQEYKGVLVWGSELILHSTSANQIREINGKFIPNLNIDINPSISSGGALEIALNNLGDAEYRWLNPEREKIIKEVYKNDSRSWKPDPKLMIAPMHGDFEKGEYLLVWKMTIAVDGEKLGNYEYFIDAKNGEIVNKFNSMPDVTGTGVSNYNGTVSFETYYNSSNQNYELYDATRNIKTYTANNSGTYPGTLLTDTDTTWTHKNGVDAHWGMQKVYDFWNIVFGRDSYNNNGSLIINTVDYMWPLPTGPNNARSAGGGQFLYGGGDGSDFSSLTALDFVGHEFNHAIDDFEANLIYQGESGALDESLADIMGTVIEFYSTPSNADWLVGEDCYTPNIS